ncbi:NACHT and WD repeat domain-containing protein [Nocardia gipuzkoensis]|uniref:NACHT and WD repeat domain-containing protein n=1 Tax=Nocardia gipuzkoensis TaxID=2749991 RepID=UPI0015EF72D9|nr:hypothetical protein [Nocardia gipuzkoensis]
MNLDDERCALDRASDTSASIVDASSAQGVQIGDHNTQINYHYRSSRPAGAMPAPLIDISGEIESPYRGLGWYTELDAPFFFGRDDAINAVLQRISESVATPGILVVSGVSGAGKSSLLRAGVVPRIRGQGLGDRPAAKWWPTLVITPGHAPLDALALHTAQLASLDAVTVRKALRSEPTAYALTAHQALSKALGSSVDSVADSRLLVVVDQFEQVFTQCQDQTQREAFVAALCAAAGTELASSGRPAALVILVVRADFEARCADFESLQDAIQKRYLVTPMTERQLRLAIAEPAKQARSAVEADLTDLLLREIRSRTDGVGMAGSMNAASGAGVLPLLSHALDSAWRTRAGEKLTAADYERTGGIERAVAESAQNAYDSLDSAQQKLTQRIFLRLTIVSADGADTADRARREELEFPDALRDDVDEVLEVFVKNRLLIVGDDTVEISHEALLSSWPMLREWLRQTHADRSAHARIRLDSRRWKQRPKDEALLYTGSVLADANATKARITADPARHSKFTSTEQDFLAAANRAERRRTLLQRTRTAVLLALVAALAVTAAVLQRAGTTSARQRDAAFARELISQSALLANTDPFGSRLTALAAWRIDPSPEARDAMVAAIADPQIAKLTDQPDPATALAVSPDGRLLATGSTSGAIQLWDLGRRQPSGDAFTGHTEAINSIHFSRDGKTLVTGSGDRTARLWDVTTHRPVGEPFTGNPGSTTAALSPDGRTLAIGTDNGSDTGIVRLTDVSTHQPIGELLTNRTGGVYEVAFSPDGRTLATCTYGKVQLWDLDSRQLIDAPFGDSATAIAFSPDGHYLAVGEERTIRLWNFGTRRQIADLPHGSRSAVLSVAFSPNGRTIGTGSDDGLVHWWDVATRHPLSEPLTGHPSTVHAVAFTSDGHLVTSGRDGSIRLWDSNRRRPLGQSLTGHFWPATSMAFTSDGRTLVTGSGAMVKVWDMPGRRLLGTLQSGDPGMISSVALNTNGHLLATGDSYGGVQFWNPRTRQPIGDRLDTGNSDVSFIEVRSESDVLATGSGDGNVKFWDARTHEQLGTPIKNRSGLLTAMALSPDGRRLVTGDADAAFRWDIATGESIGDPLYVRGGGGVTKLAISPDGRILATGSYLGLLQLWDMDTGQSLGDALASHLGTMESLSFSPDGHTLATASGGTVRLWNIASRRQIGEPFDFQWRVGSVAFSPDGKTLAVGTGEKNLKTDEMTIEFWDVGFTVDPDVRLCDNANGTFGRAEWDRYVDGPKYRQLCP